MGKMPAKASRLAHLLTSKVDIARIHVVKHVDKRVQSVSDVLARTAQDCGVLLRPPPCTFLSMRQQRRMAPYSQHLHKPTQE